LLFLFHFASDGFLFDDWNLVPFLHSALGGHLSWGQVWSQYGEPRLPLVRLEFLFFAKSTQLNTRWAIFFSAGVLIASYGLLLGLLRTYLGRRLTPISVLIVGVVWFSLANTQSALLAFEVGWYFVLFSFIAMLSALLIPQRQSKFWLAVAVLAAVIATLGTIQGLVVWPIGLVAIVWRQPKSRRMYGEAGVWVAACAVTTAVYLLSYNFSLTSCYPDFGCTPTSALAHPVTAFHYALVLIGNVVPGSFTSDHPGSYFGAAPTNVVRFELLGALLLASCIGICIRSYRGRFTVERVPLPLLLIGFSLLFDASIVWGRVGEGVSGPVINNRYVMPNIVLLTAIVIYGLAHVPLLRSSTAGRTWTTYAAWLCVMALAALVVVQVTVATEVGLTAGRQTQTFVVDGARTVVNLNRIPSGDRNCELAHYLVPADEVSEAAADHLADFSRGTYEHYRKMGPPPLLAVCTAQPGEPAIG
jgi:hypothetical protein